MIEIEIGEILYTPHTELKSTNVFGINYATQVSSPNVFVVDNINNRERNIEFEKGSINYKLNECIYSDIDDNVHIECGNWSMEYIEPVSDTDL